MPVVSTTGFWSKSAPKAWRADTGQVVPALRAFAVNSLHYRAFTGPAMTVSASGLSEHAP